MLKRLLFLAVITVFFCVSLFAGTTGKLAGRVKDSAGNPLAYVNVLIKGTQIGGQTDEKGKFMIINIPPGTYTIRFVMMGYGTVEAEKVRINVDETATQNVTMSKQAINLNFVAKIKGKTEIVKKDKTESARTVTSEQMADIPVNDLNGVIAIQAGVSKSSDGDLHVRGGRANEVVFTVDGVSVSDPVDGGSALTVDMDAVADMKVMTGGFTAEYGNAQSGMVNLVTKDGTDTYSGKIEYSNDHMFTDGRYSDEIKFAIGGPLLGYWNEDLRNKLTFFLNGNAQWDDSRYRDYYKADPNKELKYLLTDYPEYNPYASRDKVLGIEIGDRNNNAYNGNLKLKYAFSATKNLTLSVRGDRSTNTPYDHARRFALQHNRQYETNQRQYVMNYDYTINPKTNLKVKAGYYEKKSIANPKGITKDEYLKANGEYDPVAGKYGYTTLDEDGDGIYDHGFSTSNDWQYAIEGLPDPRNVSGFSAPGTIWDNFIDDKTSNISARADLEYQMDEILGFKTGMEVIKHHIEKNQLVGFLTINQADFSSYLKAKTPVGSAVNADGDTTYLYNQADYLEAAKQSYGLKDGYKADPLQAAYYLQSKMEWEGMITNIGVRFDLWYLGSSYSILKKNGKFADKDFNSDDRFQVMVSPRLGISHPISEKDVLHFAYNYQNQLPPMQYIFTSKDTTDAYNTAGVTVGNPKLEPQITVTYEVGLQHQISEDYVLDINAYYKNVYNYVSTQKEVSNADKTVKWYRYISEDYGSGRGVDITVDRRMSNFIAGTATYSLAWAQGNNSSVQVHDTNTSLREFPLDWDIRHNLNLNLTFRIDKDEEFMVPYTTWILPIDDFTASLTYNVSSGEPYTPQASQGTALLETNSARKDFRTNTDLKLTKNFSLGKSSIRAYVSIENLFKNMEISDVYAKTGSPYYDGADLTEANSNGYVYPEVQYLHDELTKDPKNYSNDRNVIVGIAYNW